MDFPGGKIEPGENASAAAVREIREETGADVTAVEVIGLRDHPATRWRVAYVACRLSDASAEPAVLDTHELEELRWVGMADALLLLPGLYEPVQSYLTRVIS